MQRPDRPISDAELRGLFEHLEQASRMGYSCDHTLSLSEAYLGSRGVPVVPAVRWLRENGAGCDCEVIFNVSEIWGSRVGYTPP